MKISQMEAIAIEYIKTKFNVTFATKDLNFEDCEGDFYFSAIHQGLTYAVGMTALAEVFFCKCIK